MGIEFDKAVDYSETGKVRAVHFDDSAFSDKKADEVKLDKKKIEGMKKEVLKTKLENASNGELKELSFESGKFSVYGVVYTVDFHWDVDGEKYDFSIPGGGCVTLGQLVEKLNIAGSAADTKSVNAQNLSALTLKDVKISDKTKEMIENVDKVEFSDPGLVWVGRIDEATTVGEIKEQHGLDVKYSSDLTKDQISKINSTKVQAGDFALISLKPFTSEETLTVTMKNGEVWKVKVTDVQLSTHAISADGEDYLITVTYGPEAGIPDGAELRAKEILAGSDEYQRYLSKAEKALGIVEYDKTSDDYPWSNKISFARFFDISVFNDGKEIEPESDVQVEIRYISNDGSLPQSNMDVVHFANSGTEVITASTSSDENEATVTFKQSSFSVTGTIINWADLEETDYYILHEDNGSWYALASDGSSVNVTSFYDPTSSSVVNYTGEKNIVWEVHNEWRNPDALPDGWYYIKAKGEDRYIRLDGSIVSGTQTSLYVQGTRWENGDPRGLWINYWSETAGGGGFFNPRYTDHFHHMLSWNEGEFGFTKYHTRRDYENYMIQDQYYGDTYPLELRFAKVTEDSEVLPGDYPNNIYNEAQIQQWLNQAMNKHPLQDVTKKASIYDYDNRIYQIDFSAKSGVLAMSQDLSLAFVTDVSNSMLFPSKLTEVAGKKSINMKSGNLDSLAHNNGEVYFTIGDKNGTSTVYALYYDNGWKAMDASYYARWKGKNIAPDQAHSAIDIGTENTKLNSKDSNSTLYTIYTANQEFFSGLSAGNSYDMSLGNMGNRLYYLESSVSNAVDDMRKIAKEYPLGAVYVALETFAGKNDDPNSSDYAVKGRQDYVKIGGKSDNIESANQTYINNYNTIYNKLKSIQGYDGTRQDVALKDAIFFGSNPGKGGYIGNNPAEKKYVVLITDGAPNPSDRKSDVIAAAKKLKENGINVITIGLSIEDVTVAPEMLYKSASGINTTNPSDDSTEARLSYWAKSGDDLTWILRDIVRGIMGQATVTSTITDKIDPLFYPVDKNGKPFDKTAVSYIRQDGTKCTFNDPNKYAKVEYKDNEWVVTWDNQNIPWGGWNSSLYVKAHEDFLGGNTVSTNKEVKFIPEYYTTNINTSNAKTAYFTDDQKVAKTEKPATPYVHVDELKMTQNSTTFMLYLGEEVTPKTELEKLWDAIIVNTVVDENGMNSDFTMKSEDDMYYDPNRSNKITQDQNPLNAAKDPVTEIPLNHYIDKSVFTNLLSQLKDNNTQTSVTSDPIDYSPYGQGKTGTLTVKIEKKVNEKAKTDAPDKHETKEVGNPAETYTITIEYKPLTGDQRKQMLIDTNRIKADDQGYMHNGDNGPGKEVNETDDQVKSTNTHKIIVVAKGLKITKTNLDFSSVLPGAKFELYRTARQGETGQQDLNGASGKYVKVADLDTSADGFATLDKVDILKENEVYYLVETKAPAGYNKLDHPIQVELYIRKEYYTADKNERYMREHDGTLSPESTLYNMVERSKLTIANDPAVRRTNYDGTGDLTHDGLNYDLDTITTMFYSIANNPGVELPSAGGPGTTWIYILGALLTIGSGMAFVVRRRLRA